MEDEELDTLDAEVEAAADGEDLEIDPDAEFDEDFPGDELDELDEDVDGLDNDDEDDDEVVVAVPVPADVDTDDDEDDDDEVGALLADIESDDYDGDDDLDELREGEFVCRSCYMAKRESALADPKRMLCRDCV